MIRILAPTGKIGYVPEEKLAQALDAGATVLTPEKMRDLRQAIFMEHGLFQDKNRRPEFKRKRKSLWRKSAR